MKFNGCSKEVLVEGEAVKAGTGRWFRFYHKLVGRKVAFGGRSILSRDTGYKTLYSWHSNMGSGVTQA